MPMGQMPILEVDGKMICQSTAIARYLARLAGKNAWGMAKAYILVDGIYDMWGHLRTVYMPKIQGDAQAAEEKWEKFKIEHLAQFLERYNNFLDSNKSGWLVGDEITWADLVVSEFLSVLQDCFSSERLSEFRNVH